MNAAMLAKYQSVQQNERDAVVALVALKDDVQARLAQIGDSVDAPNSLARDYVRRVETALSAVFGYDIANLKTTYGLNDDSQGEVPPA